MDAGVISKAAPSVWLLSTVIPDTLASRMMETARTAPAGSRRHNARDRPPPSPPPLRGPWCWFLRSPPTFPPGC